MVQGKVLDMLMKALGALLHVNNWEGFAVAQWNGDRFHGHIALGTKELGSRQCGAHFVTCEPCGARRVLAGLKDPAADALPGPRRMDEEGADLGRVPLGIQQ